mmetsp:Transcript_2409/g.7055  ORF Transcript_2409/g.7055 Transcript_2409/m.7055 type:complete len:119 (-) Transcript_2409:770-1126(-)
MVGLGMRAPNYWRTIFAVNDGDVPLHLSVTYGDSDHGHSPYKEAADIAPGGSFSFPQHTYDEGGWSSVAPVNSFEVTCMPGGRPGSTSFFVVTPTHGVEFAHRVAVHCSSRGVIGVDM